MGFYFGRSWDFLIRNRLTQLPIANLTNDRPLRIEFSFTITPDIFLNFGTVKFYNLSQKIRDSIHFRVLKSGIASGNLIDAGLGYQSNNASVFSGAIHNCYSQQQGADIITIAEVGVQIGSVTRVIPPTQKEALNSAQNIATAVQNILTTAFTDPITGPTIALRSDFLARCENALTASGVLRLDSALTPTGTLSNILKYLSQRLKIRLYRNAQNAIDVSALPTTRSPIIDTTTTLVRLSTSTGVIGTPIDYQTGVQFRTFMRPDLRIFQQVQFESKFISRTLVTQKITISGDTHDDSWYSDVDGINEEVLN